jgi:3-phenylpropionate/trans-cinnamate dioxygenase ferredoxin reductase subunit
MKIVIVGAGEAGARVGVSLREQGFDGDIALIGEEPRLPYERPPLSKGALLAGEAPVIADALRFSDLGVDFQSGVAATAIDRAARRVWLADGSYRPYDKLVLATGARARRLPGDDVCLTLRTCEDALALRARLVAGARVVIVGAGFIGLELAASARAKGCRVTVVEAAPRVLQRTTPPELSTLVEARHRAEGVEVVLGAGVAEFAQGGVLLSDGRRLAADLIVLGVGAVPEVALARAAGLTLDNGVAVDGRLGASDPDIFAIGDCASFPHPLFDGRRLRLEAWRNACDQGVFAARSLLGAQDEYRAIPWFWSDQYDQCLQIAGVPEAGARIVTRELGPAARLLFHLAQDGRLVAVGGWGTLGQIAKEIRVGEMLIARGAKPDPGSLASPSVKLKGLL